MPTAIRPTVDRRCYAHEWRAGRRAMGLQRVLIGLFSDDLEVLRANGVNVSDFVRVATRAQVEKIYINRDKQ